MTASSQYSAKILTAINAIMAKVGYVQKQGKNDFHKYRYAGEGHLLEVLRPAMVEAGLILIPSHRSVEGPDEYGNSVVTVDYTLAHKDGDVWPEKITVVGCGNDKNSKGGVGDKGIYKAATGANKYLLFKLFQIETGEDPDKDSDHDKDGAPVKVNAPADGLPEQPKNGPGISKARGWVTEHIRDINGCGEPDEFMETIEASRTNWIRICREFPGLWTGPDGSGLRGEGIKVATVLQCRPSYEAFVKAVDLAAKESAQATKE